jgi:transposase
MTQLTEKQKYEIIIKHEMNISNSKIAKDLSITRTTVIKWIKRYNENNAITRKEGSGKKKF